MTRPVELRKQSVPELEEKIRGLKRTEFVQKVQHGQRQLAKPSMLAQTRREIARMMTIVAEKKRKGEK